MAHETRPGDQYSRVEYRRLIAWEKRIERESPFLLRLLQEGPDRSVLDLGCGTGEHVAYFARQGVRAVGIDRSESMIDAARDHERAGEGRFLLGDASEAGSLLGDEPGFGLALCLGNMLPHLQDDATLDAFAAAAHGALAPGGTLLVQLLNYERIRASGVRHLPLNFREGDDGEEIVFLRLMEALPGGRLLFFPTTLSLDPDSEEPVQVRSTRRVELRAWTAGELESRFGAAGFDVTPLGDMAGGPYRADASHDLVIRAVRR